MQMGKVDFFQILLEKTARVFYSGDIIHGNLIGRVNEKLRINKLRVCFKGIGRSVWKVSNRRYEKCQEEYVNINLILLNKEGSEEYYLEAQEISLKFQIQLPNKIPSSFKYLKSRIQYTLEAIIDIPWSIDKKIKLDINIINHVDLNLNPVLKLQETIETERRFNCFCFKSNPCQVSFTLLKTGFVAGDFLKFKATFDNKSSYEIEKISFRIVQFITCISKKKSRLYERIFRELLYENRVNKNSYNEWNGMVVVPFGCPSLSKSLSKILDIKYCAKLLIKPSLPHKSFDLTIKITIGTIPLNYNSNSNQECIDVFID